MESRLGASKVLAALVFAGLFVAIPWPAVWLMGQGYELIDRANYLWQIDNQQLPIDYHHYDSALEYFTFEFLFGFVVRSASDAGLSAEAILDAITFLSVAVGSLICLRELKWRYLLLLVNPLFIALVVSQSRIALMGTALGLALLVARRSRLAALVFVVSALFIHSSAPLFVLLYVASAKRSGRSGTRAATVRPILVGILVAALVGPYLSDVLAALQDRRVDYADMRSGTLFLLFWVICLGYVVAAWPRIGDHNMTRGALAVFALASASIFFHGYAARFLALMFPVIVVGLCREASQANRGHVAVGLLVGYLALLWAYFLFGGLG